MWVSMFAGAKRGSHLKLFLEVANSLRDSVLCAAGAQPRPEERPLDGIGIIGSPTAFHKDCGASSPTFPCFSSPTFPFYIGSR